LRSDGNRGAYERKGRKGQDQDLTSLFKRKTSIPIGKANSEKRSREGKPRDGPGPLARNEAKGPRKRPGHPLPERKKGGVFIRRNRCPKAKKEI